VDSQQPSPVTKTEAPPATEEEVTASPDKEPATDAVVPLSGDTGQQPAEEPPETAVPPVDEAAAAAGSPVTGTSPESASGSTEPAAAALPGSAAATPDDTEDAVAVPEPPEKAYQLLADAREAYWLRDYDIAETKYLALTRLEPDNPDGYGELGNMYFSQGRWDEAATAYYAAGVRLVDQGLLTQAEDLIAVIRGLNGANADDLEQKIAAARNVENQ
jgi:hypothetical protein